MTFLNYMGVFMKKRFAKQDWLIPVFIAFAGSIYVYASGVPLLIVPTDKTFHFNLITINALFGGFLYTNYSLLIGLSDNKVMEKLRNTNIIEKRNHHIFNGILYATLSVIAGILLILYPDNNYLLTKLIYPFLQNSEIVFMVSLIIYFLLSLKEMNTLVNNISASDNRISKTEIEEIRRKVVSEQKKNKCEGGDCN